MPTRTATRWFKLTAAPIAGAYVQGDIVWNQTPTALGPVGWVCVESGSPGAWSPFGAPSTGEVGGVGLATTAPPSVGAANSAGAGLLAARSDHAHAHGMHTDGGLHAVAGAAAGFMSAADKTKLDGVAIGATANFLTVTSSAPANVTKAAADVGALGTAARADHKHDVATAAAVANPPGTANAEGTSTSLARADHTHALAAFGTAAGTFAQGNDARLSDDRTASGIRTATGVVSVSAATAPTAGQVLQATSGTAAAWASPGSGGGGTGLTSVVMTAPHFSTANLTSTKTLTSLTTFALYMGRLQVAATSIRVRYRVTTAAATITWAEIAIAKGAVNVGGNPSLTRLGFADVAAVVNSIGLKTTTVTLTGAAVGDDIWVLVGNQATTAAILRAASAADDLQVGVQAAVATRPSTMAAATAFTLEAATVLPAWFALVL